MASLEGRPLDSESVQLSCYSPDGETGFTVRVGRFPSAGLCWVWAHAFVPGKIVGYVDDRLPDAMRRDSTGASVWSTAAGAAIRIERVGTPDAPREVTLSASWHGHSAEHTPRGRGRTPVGVTASFRPARQANGVLAGRSEAKGSITGAMRVAGRTINLTGDGHYHEQRQTTPRFTVPFVYLRGGGDDLAFTFIGSNKSSGALITPAGEVTANRLMITPPASTRQFRVALDDGRELDGTIVETHRFWVPIFGHERFSQIVTGTLGGQRWVGGVNDWLGERLTYWRV